MAKIEIFIAGCPNCEVTIFNLQKGEGRAEAGKYGVTRVPTVVVNGKIAVCCNSSKVDAAVLRSMGVGA